MQTRHAIITGGSSGIGLALASILVKTGWNVSIIARDPARLQDARNTLGSFTETAAGSLHAYSADVADREQLQSVIKQAVEAGGTPSLLVTSAGIARPGYFTELSLDDFETLNRVNYLGTVYSVKAVVPFMQAARRGHIVMIASGAGLAGLFGYTAYAPSKFAVRGFAESLRPELKRDGIRVSIVYPPDTQTPQLAGEEKLKPLETRYITGAGGVMSADDVAGKILAGIERGRFSITPGMTMFWLSCLHSIAAPLLRLYFDHLADKAKKKLNRNAEPR